MDYSSVLQGGVDRDVLERLLAEHDRAREHEAGRLQDASAADSGEIARLREEMARVREEVASSMSGLRAMLVEGDGDLHEMQLASLRRQMSQLEGVLESNYQRELRIAEERERSLRSEMEQMRQDLRVALETLYRMPDEAHAPREPLDLTPVEEQIKQIATAWDQAARQQQRAAADQEKALRSELAQVRSDLLATLEASYTTPGGANETVATEIAAWKSEVEKLRRAMADMRSSQDMLLASEHETIREGLGQLRAQLQETLEAAAAAPGEEDASTHLEILESLSQHIDQGNSVAEERWTAMQTRVDAQIASLEKRLDSVQADIRAGIDDLRPALTDLTAGTESEALASVLQQIATLRAELEASRGRESELLEGQRNAVSQSVNDLRLQLVELLESSRPETTEADRVSAVHQLAEEAIRGLERQEVELRDLLSGQAGTIRGEIVGLLDAERARQDAALLRLQETLADGTEQWSAFVTGSSSEQAQAIRSDLEALRETVSGLAETVQSMAGESERREDEAQAALSQQLEALNARLDVTDGSGITDVRPQLAELHTIIGDLRHDVTRVLDVTSTIPRAEEAEAFAAREVPDIAELRQELNALRAELREGRPDGGAELHQELAELREGLSATLDSVVSNQASSQTNEGMQALSEQLAALQCSLDDTRLRYEETVQSEIAQLRAQLAERAGAAVEAEQGTVAHGLHEELAELRETLTAMKQGLETHAAPGAAELSGQIAALREEMTGALAEQREAAPAGGYEELAAQIRELREEAQAERSQEYTGPADANSQMVTESLRELRLELASALASRREEGMLEVGERDGGAAARSELAEMAETLRRSNEEQQRASEAQATALQAAVDAMRQELHATLGGLSRESVDSFEKRQTQLRMDQLEMERNLAKLRQELVSTQVEVSSKKKLFR